MCPCCGRFLPQEEFGLEHLIPQQAVKRDPATVRNNPATPVNVRSGNLLLCRKPLKHRGNVSYPNGCNSWKGKFYDAAIRDLTSDKAWKPGQSTQVHLTAALCLGYLAMVAKFGHVITLMRSGLGSVRI